LLKHAAAEALAKKPNKGGVGGENPDGTKRGRFFKGANKKRPREKKNRI